METANVISILNRGLAMIAEKYGVGLVMFDGDEKSHPCVQFGDGLTRIFTTVWDKDNVGLKIAKVVDDLPEFHGCEYDKDSPPHKTDGNEVHILFDNPRSIDAMIGQLEYIKAVMLGDEQDDLDLQ
ncbi:hypothetical protein S140_48 [Shewanella sp. phage 1/40]|uniref:hypothetical protein n=1 Tax=Shewanella sp. phage 1/40 TaxID=1458860 RepID=UPI0004F7CEF7|nr:hypothetical protein S140_48 [Shewanella sp. phage 1/40]AHK11458.1 hypothetical protein S140_48 [Shewanella sp. phage 1/40]